MHLLADFHDSLVETGVAVGERELLLQEAVAHAVALGFVAACDKGGVLVLQRNTAMFDNTVDGGVVGRGHVLLLVLSPVMRHGGFLFADWNQKAGSPRGVKHEPFGERT